MKKLLIFSIGALLLSGCASMSTMQTARTTDEGELAWSVGGGFINSEIPLGELDTMSLSMPMLEVGARYGINDKLDVGAKLTIIGTAVVDGKYQFLGDKESKFAGSAGLGLGYLSIESGDSESTIFDIMVPTYFSYHPNEWLALYTSPKYILRNNSYNTGVETGSQASHWYGVGTGLRIGKKTAFFVEYSHFTNSEISEPFSQINAGIGIRIN